MRRRWLLINGLLLAANGVCAWVFEQRWQQARQRERRLAEVNVEPLPVPPFTPLVPPKPASPANFLETAQKNLFSRDRNPNVIIEVAPPPPPKPVPPFPLAYGVIDLGGGPTVILAEKPGAPHHSYRAGDQVGPFRIVALNHSQILFEWDGKRFLKDLEELADRSAPPPREQTAASAAPAPAPAPAAAAGLTTVTAKTPAGPGADVGGGFRACVPGDPTPVGTVRDGLRKVVLSTPFGDSCRWEPVK